MMTVLGLLLAVSTAQASPTVSRCGVSVDVPEGWLASPAYTIGKTCWFGVWPPDWQQVREQSDFATSEEAIRIEVTPGGLLDLFASGRLFRDEDGSLRTGGGPAIPGEATETTTDCCAAIRGYASVGLTWKTGGHSGYDSVPFAVVFGDGRYAELSADIALQRAEDMLGSLIASLRFEGPPNKQRAFHDRR